MMATFNDIVHREVENLCRAGKWAEIFKMYKEQRELRTDKITKTGETILHLAVLSGKEQVVEDMVDFVCGERTNNNEHDKKWPLLQSVVDENGDERKFILEAEDDMKNTPLHLAVSVENINMCKKIGSAHPSSITKRNNAGETPLFVAALRGERKIFLWLHYLYMASPGVSSTDFAHCLRRDNDDTVLHCAIARGHLDVAIEIVHLYKDHLKEMTTTRNKNGLSPLHLLAVAPYAFASTDLPHRHFVVKFLYHWYFRVTKKNQATTREELEQRERQSCIRILGIALVEYISSRLDEREETYWALIVNIIMVLLGVLALLPLIPPILAENWFHGIRRMKEQHAWSLGIMEELLHHASDEYLSEITSISPSKPRSASPATKEDNETASKIVDAPLMIATKSGVIEMVEKILDFFPSTMKAVNEEGKNIVLLVAEKRQNKMYQILCENNEDPYGSAFSQVDKNGNTALHLAAKLGVNLNMQTTTMVEEFKWFELVKSSVPPELWEAPNNDGKRAEEIFRESFEQQMTRDREWVNQISEACSVVSTLVASMAFAHVAVNFDKKNYSSLLALSLSLTSTISFLSILAFRSRSLYLWRYVPFRLHLAILTMFGSIVALWISLMLHDHSFKPYAIIGLPIALVTIFSLPTFIGPTLTYMFTEIPIPNRKTISAIRSTKNLNPPH